MTLRSRQLDTGLAARRAARRAFTLIELIAVMAILTMTVSIAAPKLSNFFRGRALSSEARRLLALTHAGQTRAISEGIPMDVWIDATQQAYGLSAEPSYELQDSKAESIPLDNNIQIDVVNLTSQSAGSSSTLAPADSPSTPPVLKARPELPSIRFLPSGLISETSPEMIKLTSSDGEILWLVITENRTGYEITNRSN